VPRGSPYNHMEDRAGRGRMAWKADVACDCASGWRGPMVGYHVVVGKFPMRARNKIFKNKKMGPPNLAAKLQAPMDPNNTPNLEKFQTIYIYIYTHTHTHTHTHTLL
jgi:hypothetical protein